MSFSRHRRKKRKRKLKLVPVTETKPYTPSNPVTNTDNSYEITKICLVEDELKQCQAAEAGVLPKHPFRMYVVGASGSGKSNFILNLLTRKNMYKDYFDTILVVSPTAVHLDPNYRALNLKEDHFFDPDEEVLERIMEIQEEVIEEKGKSEAPKVLLVLDDIISYKQFVASPILLKFAVMSRHWNISLMILSQAYHRIPKSVRLQMSSIVFFKGSNKELEVLSEDFGVAGKSYKEFMRAISYATNKRFDFFFVDLHRTIENGRYRKNLTEYLFVNSAVDHKSNHGILHKSKSPEAERREQGNDS